MGCLSASLSHVQVNEQNQVVISMTANQLTMLAVRRAARALRRVHSEQVLMWEGFWRANRFP